MKKDRVKALPPEDSKQTSFCWPQKTVTYALTKCCVQLLFPVSLTNNPSVLVIYLFGWLFCGNQIKKIQTKCLWCVQSSLVFWSLSPFIGLLAGNSWTVFKSDIYVTLKTKKTYLQSKKKIVRFFLRLGCTARTHYTWTVVCLFEYCRANTIAVAPISCVCGWRRGNFIDIQMTV